MGNSLQYAKALTAAVSTELHVLPHGRHGLGLAPDVPEVAGWSRLCEDWLRRGGWAEPVRDACVTSRSRLNRPLALLVAGTFFMEILDGTILSTAAPAIAADLGVAPVDINTAMTGYRSPWRRASPSAAGSPNGSVAGDPGRGHRRLHPRLHRLRREHESARAGGDADRAGLRRRADGAGRSARGAPGDDKADMLDAIAYLTWPALLAPVIAPTLGGWIVTVASWHWIFLINVPLGVLAFVITFRVVPATRADHPPPWTGWASVLCGGSLAAFMIFIELLQPEGGLERGAVLISGVAGAAFIIATGWWLRRARHPILRFNANRVHTFAVSNLGGGGTGW